MGFAQCLLRAAIVVAAVGWIAAGQARADSVVIDDFSGEGTFHFSSEHWPLTLNSTTTFFSGEEAGAPGVYGGSRREVVSPGYLRGGGTLTSPGDSATYSLNESGGASTLAFGTTGGGTAKIRLDYGGFPQGDTALDLHLPAVGNVITLGFSELALSAGGSMVVQAVVSQHTGPTSWSGSGSPPVSITTSGAQSIVLPIGADFASTYTSTDEISVMLYPTTGTTFQLDSVVFSGTPEPASLGILGAGSILLLRKRR